MTTPLVSVITPAYGSEEYIEETIQSVLNQDYLNFEFIIINDGSPDNLEDIVLRHRQGDKRIRYISQKNQGMCATRNDGADIATGKYLAFLDNDDLWERNNLSVKVQFLESNENIGLVHSDTEIIDGSSNKKNIFLRGKSGNLLNDLLSWNGTCIPAPSSILVRKSVHEKIGGFDPNLSIAGDKDYFIRVANLYEIGRIESVTWYYRIHENNYHKNIAVMEKDEIYILKKNVESKFYKTRIFKMKCFSNTYMILGKSWWKDGANPYKGFKLILKSLFVFPLNILKLF